MPARKRPDYLATVNERVVVFDGAFGTYVQGEDLTADDFGGQHLEGCNELLAITRPDLIAKMHEDFLKVGVDALETATFGSFGTVLAEYGIAGRAHEITLAATRIAREVANSFESDGRPRYVAGSVGPAPSCRASGTFLSSNYATPTKSTHAHSSRAVPICCSLRRAWTCCRSRPRCKAADARCVRCRARCPSKCR